MAFVGSRILELGEALDRVRTNCIRLYQPEVVCTLSLPRLLCYVSVFGTITARIGVRDQRITHSPKEILL